MMRIDSPRSAHVHRLVIASSLNTRESRRYRSQTPAATREQLLAKLFTIPQNDPPRYPHTPYFFLSHAAFARWEEAADVRRFFELLCGRLLPLTAHSEIDDDPSEPAPALGVLAEDVRVKQGAALLPDTSLTCRVFVPLLSQRYGRSERCLSELEAFRRRDDQRRRHLPFEFSAIVPVLWTGAPDLELPAHLNLDVDTTWGDDYYDVGLQGLMRSKSRYFHRVLFRILERIRDLAEVVPVGTD
jgi:hypothetical protein